MSPCCSYLWPHRLFLLAIFHQKSLGLPMWLTTSSESSSLSGPLPHFFKISLSLSLFFFFFCFLGPHLRHLGVLRLGVEWELQLLTYVTATATPDLSHVCNLHHSSWPRWILNPLCKARDRTYNLMDTSQVCYC